MSTNLKFKIDEESSITEIRCLLHEYSAFSKISALMSVNESNINELLDEVKISAYDYRPSVRMYAYKALVYANPQKITEVLKDALRDEDKDAFHAARELYSLVNHRN